MKKWRAKYESICKFSDHRYGQTPPIPSTRTGLRRLRFVKRNNICEGPMGIFGPRLRRFAKPTSSAYIKRGGGKERHHFIIHALGAEPFCSAAATAIFTAAASITISTNTEEEEETRILKGNASISIIIIIIIINVYIFNPLCLLGCDPNPIRIYTCMQLYLHIHIAMMLIPFMYE